jgi:hypothetical protein
MKKLVLLLAIAILASCSPTKRLARLLEKYPQPEKIDTVYTPGKTVYKDTTVFKFFPGETSVEHVYVDVPVALPDTFIEAHTSTADAIAWLQNNELGLQLIQYDTLIQWKIDSAIRIHSDTILIEKEKIVTVTEYKDRPFYKNSFFILGGIILISLILLFAFRKR